MLCPRCASQRPDEDNFCARCGAALTRDPAPRRRTAVEGDACEAPDCDAGAADCCRGCGGAICALHAEFLGPDAGYWCTREIGHARRRPM